MANPDTLEPVRSEPTPAKLDTNPEAFRALAQAALGAVVAPSLVALQSPGSGQPGGAPSTEHAQITVSPSKVQRFSVGYQGVSSAERFAIRREGMKILGLKQDIAFIPQNNGGQAMILAEDIFAGGGNPNPRMNGNFRPTLFDSLIPPIDGRGETITYKYTNSGPPGSKDDHKGTIPTPLFPGGIVWPPILSGPGGQRNIASKRVPGVRSDHGVLPLVVDPMDPTGMIVDPSNNPTGIIFNPHHSGIHNRGDVISMSDKIAALVDPNFPLAKDFDGSKMYLKIKGNYISHLTSATEKYYDLKSEHLRTAITRHLQERVLRGGSKQVCLTACDAYSPMIDHLVKGKTLTREEANAEYVALLKGQVELVRGLKDKVKVPIILEDVSKIREYYLQDGKKVEIAGVKELKEELAIMADKLIETDLVTTRGVLNNTLPAPEAKAKREEAVERIRSLAEAVNGLPLVHRKPLDLVVFETGAQQRDAESITMKGGTELWAVIQDATVGMRDLKVTAGISAEPESNRKEYWSIMAGAALMNKKIQPPPVRLAGAGMDPISPGEMQDPMAPQGLPMVNPGAQGPGPRRP